jgi:hypothetical protein
VIGQATEAVFKRILFHCASVWHLALSAAAAKLHKYKLITPVDNHLFSVIYRFNLDHYFFSRAAPPSEIPPGSGPKFALFWLADCFNISG